MTDPFGPVAALDSPHIDALLRGKDLEDVAVLDRTEFLLKRLRGHVFRMPAPGEAVVFHLSGGIDSVTTAVLLMEGFGLVLYPLFLRRGHARVHHEARSLEHYTALLAERYPRQFRPVFQPEVRIPPLELRPEIIGAAARRVRPDSEQRRGIPMFASLMGSYAVQYAYVLEQRGEASTRTILCGAHETDGQQMAHHTLTGLRVSTLNMIGQTADHGWQYTSPWIERSMGRYHGKDELVRWAAAHDLDLSHTWSCYQKGRVHCGQCFGCLLRRNAFIGAGVTDPTEYAC